MAEGSGRAAIVVTAEDAAVRELAASQRELVGSVVRQIDFAVGQMGLSPSEARDRYRGFLHDDPDTVEADRVGWDDLADLIEEDEGRGLALWQRLKAEAAEELATGMRTARALERPVADRPADRAAFVAVLAALRRSLAPRDELEDLLVQQMAAVYDLHLSWQSLLARRMEEEVWHGERDKRRALEWMGPAQRERYEALEGWLPPRVSDAEAVEQAAVLSDRFQRAFLRLLKAFRDNRRLFASLIVAGGQINIGEQQLNIAGHPSAEAAPQSE